jgi:hypothetical protein
MATAAEMAAGDCLTRKPAAVSAVLADRAAAPDLIATQAAVTADVMAICEADCRTLRAAAVVVVVAVIVLAPSASFCAAAVTTAFAEMAEAASTMLPSNP